MDQTPPPSAVFAPPPEPRRPAWEVALLFAGILTFLGLWGWAQWAMNARGKYAPIRGVAEVRLAERFAGVALASSGVQQQVLWQRAIDSYRDALKENPTMPRARRGLAAALYLTGDKAGAKETMRGPVDLADVPDKGVRAWEATQTAFGARPRPVRASALEEERQALQDPKLGWARYTALMALAPSRAAADTYRAEMTKAHAGKAIVWAGGLAFVGMIILVPLGLYFLDRGLRLPRNLLPPLHVTTAGLIVMFVVALVVYQGVTNAVVGAIGFLLAAGKKTPPDQFLGTRGMIGLLFAGSLAGAACAYAYAGSLLRRAGSSLSALGWRARDAVKWALGGYVAMMPLLAVALLTVSLLTRMFPKVTTPQNPAVDMVTAMHGLGLIPVFLLVCVVAPLAEELLFRGLLFRGLEKRYGLLVGALAAGLLFAGMHPQLPFGFPPVFALGVGLCYVYRISGSLVPGILIHALNNTIALVMAILTMGR